MGHIRAVGLKMGAVMNRYNDDIDDLERCRAARIELDRRFKTLDEQFDFLRKLEKRPGRHVAALAKTKRVRREGRRPNSESPQPAKK